MGVINLGILVKKIMSKISGAGYIKDTDYASSSKGGTIKVDTTYATDVTTGGKLKAKEITAEAYSEANDAAFISKATLDNVLAAQPSGGVTVDELFNGSVTQGVTTWKTLSHAYTDYKLLHITDIGSSGTSHLFSAILNTGTLATGSNNSNSVPCGANAYLILRFDAEDATHFCLPQGSGSKNLIIVGIK